MELGIIRGFADEPTKRRTFGKLEPLVHAEKYFRTVTEEYAAARPAFRAPQLVALARVKASEYGYPAPSYQ